MVFPFKLERTAEALTAHGGLALMAEYNHGLGLRILTDQYVPGPWGNRWYAPSVFMETCVLMLQAEGWCLEDLRGLERETALMALIGQEALPDPDTLGVTVHGVEAKN